MCVLENPAPTLEIHVTPAVDPDRAANRPPLVFVHGAFAGAWCWLEYFVPYFSHKGYTTVAFSLRGHGDSEGADCLDLASLGDYAHDLSRVLDGLDRPAVLIGHSMGGMVVQKYLETGSAAAMVLMASVGPWGLLESSWHMMLANPGLAQGISFMQTVGKSFINPDVLYEGLFSSEVPFERAERYYHQFQRESQRVILDMTVWDVPRQPPRLPVPTLVMGATDDAFIPRSMVLRTARYFDADPVMVPDMAHAMMLEENWRHAADPILHWLVENGM
jgi:pimeloyl-ACP methyl ester carboxylesterase